MAEWAPVPLEVYALDVQPQRGLRCSTAHGGRRQTAHSTYCITEVFELGCCDTKGFELPHMKKSGGVTGTTEPDTVSGQGN